MSTVSHSPAWASHLPVTVRPEQVDLLAGGSLVGRWTRLWREYPARPQLQDVDGSWLTSGELEERSRHAAERLRGAGLSPGDRIVLSGAASAKLVVAYVAALRAGLVVVPLNTAYPQL